MYDRKEKKQNAPTFKTIEKISPICQFPKLGRIYEYFDASLCANTLGELRELLNEIGSEGWEIIHIHKYLHNAKGQWYFHGLAKRGYS